ncbi:class I adenylate-forming enzyme family protein [Brevibacterium pityocampae]|uniref:Long-chain acyl-CoA synthetase n=1 Tax=Brevibacterium pityocampae TaxID=506594 RepID=A0ABP8J5W0_9MICO
MKPFSTPIDSPYGTVGEMWRAAVDEAGDRPFIHSFDASWTFAEVDDRARKLAAALGRAGVGRGDRVALYTQNDPIFVIGLVAAFELGAIAVPINPMNTARELRYQLENSGARALVTIPELHRAVAQDVVGDTAVALTVIGDHTKWSQQGEDVEVVAVRAEDGLGPDVVAAGSIFSQEPPAELAPPEVSTDDIAILTYTSGTTGKPKGAQNTHRNLVFNAESYLEITGLEPGQPVLGIAPLFHITGMVGHIMVAIRARSPIVLSHRFHPEVMLRSIRTWRPVFAVGAITALMALADSPAREDGDFDSLITIFSGGAPIAPVLADRLEEIFGAYVHNIYGMSETASPTHSVPRGQKAPVDPTSGALSVGQPIYRTRSRIVDETGEECATGSYGEILSAGPQITSGYWENPDATEQAFDGEFLRTGDVGFVDEDGWFYLVDRKKDMINASGYKVWPREVEDVLYGHPAVSEAAVVGVPDPYRGETVKAFVTLKAGHSTDADELIEHCRSNMAAYKYPRQVEIREEMPKTATGKILRRQLRE